MRVVLNWLMSLDSIALKLAIRMDKALFLLLALQSLVVILAIENCYFESAETEIYFPEEKRGHCQLFLKRSHPTVCKIEIEFRKSDLEEQQENSLSSPKSPTTSSECAQDFLTVSGSAGEIVSLCGHINIDGKMEVPFPREDASLHLTLQGHNQIGKWAVRQRFCSEKPQLSKVVREQDVFCNQTEISSASELTVTSKNYPLNYPNNWNYCLLLYKSNPNICSLEVLFQEFRLEASEISEECAFDFLQISEANENSGEKMERQRYCGNFTGIRLLEMQGPKRLLFHTNEVISDIGFSLKLRQVECLSSTSTSSTTTTISTTTTSPTDTVPPRTPSSELPTYHPPTTTTITATSTTSTSTTSAIIITARSPSTPDVLPSYHPPTTKATTSIVYSTTATNPFIWPTTSTSTYPFPQKTCVKHYDMSFQDEIVLTSPNYPEPYPCGCIHEVKIQNACSVQVDLIKFSVGERDFYSNQCIGDAIELGSWQVCGQRDGSSYLITVTEDVVPINLIKRNFNKQWPGFFMTLKKIPCFDYSGWQPVTTPRTSTPPLTFKPPYKPQYKPHYSYTPKNPDIWNWPASLARKAQSLFQSKIDFIRSLFAPQRSPSKPTYNRPYHRS